MKEYDNYYATEWEKHGIMLDFSDLVNLVGQEKADCSAIYYFLFRGCFSKELPPSSTHVGGVI